MTLPWECYRLPGQDEEVDETLLKQPWFLWGILTSLTSAGRPILWDTREEGGWEQSAWIDQRKIV